MTSCEYQKVAMYEVPDYVHREKLGVYLMQYLQLVNVIPEFEMGKWVFE